MPILSMDRIESFVRNVLGCQCPDEVFQRIETTQQQQGSLRYQRILIGRRLLVYLLLPSAGKDALADFSDLVRHGLDERDRNGWNRCRIALFGDVEGIFGAEMEAVFNRVAGGDPKMHLHRLSETQLTIDPD